MPAAWRCVLGQASVRSGGRGGVMMVFTSPRLVAMLTTSVLLMTWKALARAVSGSLRPSRRRTHAAARPLLAHRQLMLPDARRAPGSTRARCPAAASSQLRNGQCVRAVRLHAHVERLEPLSTTQALNGDSTMPAVRHRGPNTSTISFDGPADRARHHAALARRDAWCPNG